MDIQNQIDITIIKIETYESLLEILLRKKFAQFKVKGKPYRIVDSHPLINTQSRNGHRQTKAVMVYEVEEIK